MDIIAIITLLGIVQGFFIGIYFTSKKSGNVKSDRFLGALFISFSLSITHFFFQRTGIYIEYPYLAGISLPVLFVFGPLFLYYVKLLVNRNYKLNPKDFLHLLPFFLSIIYMIPDYLNRISEKIRISNDGMELSDKFFLSLLQIVHLFIYITVIYKIVEKHKELIKRSESSIENKDLNWVQKGIICFAATFGLMLVLWFLFALGINTMRIFHITIPIMVSIIIFSMGYLGLKQSEVLIAPEEPDSISIKKYEKSTLTNDKAEEYVTKIKSFMDETKPHLDSDLSLQKLASMLNIHTHHLSQIINENFNQNFFDFINSYRIAEARKLLIDPKNSTFTILAIAEESGFNSKTSFNNAFKRYTGVTPSEYKKLNIKNLVNHL